VIEIGFNGYDMSDRPSANISNENIFDVIEYLYKYVSKPGPLVPMTDETGWNYHGYEYFSTNQGQYEFRQDANKILITFAEGFELNKNGEIVFLGDEGINLLFNADIPEYDFDNIDAKVIHAISLWRNRNLDLSQRREAIKDLADVFEWLKKDSKLSKILNRKDENAIFDIANNFSIRHHNPEQQSNYDKNCHRVC
jgi:hypothetical protein